MNRKPGLLMLLMAGLIVFFIGPVIHALTAPLFIAYWEYHYGAQGTFTAVVVAYVFAFGFPFFLLLSMFGGLMFLYKLEKSKRLSR